MTKLTNEGVDEDYVDQGEGDDDQVDERGGNDDQVDLRRGE